MPFTPQETDVQKLFAQPQIEIPPYQRSYSWRKGNVESLWTDINDFFINQTANDLMKGKRRYFLGTIVIIAKTARIDLVLDGQQRLATLTLFLSALRDVATTLKNSTISNNLISDIDNLLYARVTQKQRTLRLSLNREDKSYFNTTIQSNITTLPEARTNSHKLIKGTRELLQARVRESLHGKSDVKKAKELTRLFSIIQFCLSFLTVKVDNEQEACDIFEHLNNRGVALGLADLLRNMLFRKTDVTKHDDLAEQWDTLLAKFPDGGISDLIRYSWLSRYRVISRNQIYNQINKEIIPIKVSSYLIHLSNDATAYELVTARTRQPNSELTRALKTFQILAIRQCMPLVIATRESCPDAFTKTLQAINTFSFTFSTICNKNPNFLEVLYSQLAHYVREHKSDPDVVIAHIIAQLRSKLPTEIEFVQRFADFSTSKAELQKYILSELESYLGCRKAVRVADSDVVWVEHIYSQKPRLKWDGHGEWVNRIGNLALLIGSENSRLSNKNFINKVDTYKNSELYITKSLASSPDEWTKTRIESRQALFAQSAKVIWKL